MFHDKKHGVAVSNLLILQTTMSKKQVIIDTDCGIDDAQAILMALAAPNIELLAVTCVFGNTAVENVCQNVLRVLSVCEREGLRFNLNPEEIQIYYIITHTHPTDSSLSGLRWPPGWSQKSVHRPLWK